MPLFSKTPQVSDVQQSGENNSQQIANNIDNSKTTNIFTTPANEASKSSIIQDILENIIDLEIEFEATKPDTTPFDIEGKIDHNDITLYKESYEFFMGHKFLIEDRLKTLEDSGNHLASKKLFSVIRNIYHKHLHLNNPDRIISLMQDELKKDLIINNMTSHDNIMFVPSIIFYVFAECKIFKKPPS